VSCGNLDERPHFALPSKRDKVATNNKELVRKGEVKAPVGALLTKKKLQEAEASAVASVESQKSAHTQVPGMMRCQVYQPQFLHGA
jgi:hypothetical protein